MIKLEQFTISDAEVVIGWIDTEELLVQFSGTIFNFPLTKNQINQYLKEQKRTVFKVMYTKENIFVGIAELYNFSENTAKIARVLIGDESIRGKGIGTMLIRQLVKYAAEVYQKSFVTLNVYDWNIGAIRCYEKVGFIKTNKEPVLVNVGNKKWKSIEMQIKI